MPATSESLERIRTEQAAAGIPAGLPWWRSELGRFYRTPGAKRFAARVGRGGAKSTNMVDCALNETLCGDWNVPIGERHYFAFASKSKDEAGQRLGQIEARLRALGIPADRSGDEIALRDMPRGFRVFACTVGAVSGFRCFGFVADELAKWTNADHSANPAPEVVASLRAMTVTHPNAREFFVSSPLGTEDLHFEIIEAGDSADQVVAIAPTWVANPSVTEEQTRRLEPDSRIWSREYAAIPTAGVIDDFFGEGLTAALSDEPPDALRPVFALDPAFANDAFGWAVISSQTSAAKDELGRPRRVTYVHAAGAWKANGAKPSELLARFKREIAVRYPTKGDMLHAYSDQFEGYSLQEIARGVGITITVVPWTGGEHEGSKNARYRAVRAAMYEGALKVRRSDTELIREMRTVRSIISKSGNERIETPRNASGHGDRTSAVVLAASIALERSPTAPEPLPDQRTEQEKMRQSAERAALKAHKERCNRDRFYLVNQHIRRQRAQLSSR